jgi:hypothetical protein
LDLRILKELGTHFSDLLILKGLSGVMEDEELCLSERLKVGKSEGRAFRGDTPTPGVLQKEAGFA